MPVHAGLEQFLFVVNARRTVIVSPICPAFFAAVSVRNGFRSRPRWSVASLPFTASTHTRLPVKTSMPVTASSCASGCGVTSHLPQMQISCEGKSLQRLSTRNISIQWVEESGRIFVTRRDLGCRDRNFVVARHGIAPADLGTGTVEDFVIIDDEI